MAESADIITGFNPAGAYYGSQNASRDNRRQNAIDQLRAALPGMDREQATQAALAAGDQDLARTLIQMAQNDQQQSNADRSFGLQERQFSANQSNAAASRAIQQARLNLTAAERTTNAETKAKIREGTAKLLVSKGLASSLEEAAALYDAGLHDDVFNAANKPASAASAVGKIRSDLKNGLISEADANAAISKATAQSGGITIGPDGTVQIGGGNIPVTTKTKNDAVAANTAYKSIESGLGRLETLLKDEGFAIPGTPAAKRYATERRGIQLQLKELFNLGVLNGPDLELMDQMLIDPSSIQSGAFAATGQFPKAAKDNLEQVRNIIKSIRDNAVSNVPGFDPPPASAPQPGTVDGGYQFKGGDPADPNNWQKVQ